MLRFYRDWIADCPDELMTIVVQRRAPALPIVPAELVGRHVIAVAACYAGPVEDGARAMRPLKSFGQAHARPMRAQALSGSSVDV